MYMLSHWPFVVSNNWIYTEVVSEIKHLFDTESHTEGEPGTESDDDTEI